MPRTPLVLFLTITPPAYAAIHHGNPGVVLEVDLPSGWSASTSPATSTTVVHIDTTSTPHTAAWVNPSTTHVQGWTVPTASITHTEVHAVLQLDLTGPDGKVIEVDLETDLLDLGFATTESMGSDAYVVLLGDGGWIIDLADGMSAHTTLVIDDASIHYDDVVDALSEGALYLDSDDDGILSASECASPLAETP